MIETAKQKSTTQHRVYTIHVFAHVKKFLKKNVPSKNGVFRSEEYSTFGKMVTLALRDTRPWKQATGKGDDFFRDRLTESIVIQLTEEQARMSPRLNKLQRINVDLDRMFKESLIGWIEAQSALGTPVHSACKLFLQHYQLDEKEYSLDSAYKHWQRSQK